MAIISSTVTNSGFLRFLKKTMSRWLPTAGTPAPCACRAEKAGGRKWAYWFVACLGIRAVRPCFKKVEKRNADAFLGAFAHQFTRKGVFKSRKRNTAGIVYHDCCAVRYLPVRFLHNRQGHELAEQCRSRLQQEGRAKYIAVSS